MYFQRKPDESDFLLLCSIPFRFVRCLLLYAVLFYQTLLLKLQLEQSGSGADLKDLEPNDANRSFSNSFRSFGRFDEFG